MAKVCFDHVSKVFDEHTTALRQLSLEIADGEFLVLVGPSGCGKSTALRLLAGLDSVTEGNIYIDDKLVNEYSPQQRNVAMVFQNYALYPHMSVRANLEFPLKMAGMESRVKTEKVTRISELLDLSALLDRKPKQLSGGQRQRVAMGRALVRDPSVFLLDEPLSNLDAKLRAQIRADMASLHKRLGKTSLYVTHDQVEAMTLGDRVAVLHAGALQQVGTPEVLYEQPQNIFVAKFIGSPGMNIMRCMLSRSSDESIEVRLGRQSICMSDTWPHTTNIKQGPQQLYLGIRPEAFHRQQADGRAAIQVEVSGVEFLGHESLVYFQLLDNREVSQTDNNELWVARLTGKYRSPQDKCDTFYVDENAVCLFDDTGVRIE